MKQILTMLCALFALNASAQEETIPPKWNGADVERFMARLTGETEKVVLEKEIPVAELTQKVVVAFRIDTAGGFSEWRFVDKTCEGRDQVDAEPATARTREAVTAALERLGGEWSPAVSEGRKIPYTWRLTLRLPLEKITKLQDSDPLLFMDEDPDKSFYAWAKARIHYDARHVARGVEGVVQVRFYIEPNGNIAIGDVMKTPDDKLSKEVIRVIRSSKGKWTPRFVNGVAQRTAYIFALDCFHQDNQYEPEE